MAASTQNSIMEQQKNAEIGTGSTYVQKRGSEPLATANFINDHVDKPHNEILKVKQYLSDQKPPTPAIGSTPNRRRKLKDANLETYNKIQAYTDKRIPNNRTTHMVNILHENSNESHNKFYTPAPDERSDDEILLRRSDHDKRKMKTGSVQANYSRGAIAFTQSSANPYKNKHYEIQNSN